MTAKEGRDLLKACLDFWKRVKKEERGQRENEKRKRLFLVPLYLLLVSTIFEEKEKNKPPKRVI